ncbi:hypothetical protein G6F68_019623 [Rhizopus microsporus]|nr:hypothetical protein G6F68_019623 [Rhizopus microsporus]
MEESFLRRRATSTGSSMATTSEAATISIRSRATPRCSESAASIASGSPTSNSRVSGNCRANSIAAGIVTGRPKSPPIQSMAMRITGARYQRSAELVRVRVRPGGLIRRPWSSGPCGHGKSRWG